MRKTYKELKRGDVIEWSNVPGYVTLPVIVISVSSREAGGAGMGEYPATRTVTLSDTRQMKYDDWTRDRRTPKEFEVTRTVSESRDGRLME